MSQRFRLGLFLFFTTLSLSGRGETIWERAKNGAKTEEREMRRAVERVLLGIGDERDLLQARVGLITLSRGEVNDPRTIVLLLRMRREMGLSSSRSTLALLHRAQLGELSLIERCWAKLELAHDHLSRGQLDQAHHSLSLALRSAWRAQVRAEILILRGFVNVRLLRGTEALEDFSDATTLKIPRRLLVQAQIGAAVAFALRGDDEKVRESALTAATTQATRATVSGLDPFWDLGLSQEEAGTVRGILTVGEMMHKGVTSLGEEDRNKLSAACSVFERDGESRAPQGSDALDVGKPLWPDLVARTMVGAFEMVCRPLPTEAPAQ